MASSPITSWQIDGETMETVTDFIFLSSKITADDDWSHQIKRHLILGRKAMTVLNSILKNRDIPNKGLYSQSYDLSSSHVWMLSHPYMDHKMDHKENWAPKNWCFRTVVLEKILQVPLHNEVKAVNPKGNHSWCWSWNSNTLVTCCKTWTQKKTLILGMVEGRRRREW